MKKLIIALAVTLASVSIPSLAQTEESNDNGFYVGANYAALTLADELDLGVAYARFGYAINDYFSVEARIGTGVKGEESSDIVDEYYYYSYSYEEELSVNSFYGAYILAGIPLGNTFYPYAFIGYTNAKLEYEVEVKGIIYGDYFTFEQSVSDSESDTSYGIGMNITPWENVEINLEYSVYLDASGFNDDGDYVEGDTFDGFSVGLTYKF